MHVQPTRARSAPASLASPAARPPRRLRVAGPPQETGTAPTPVDPVAVVAAMTAGECRAALYASGAPLRPGLPLDRLARHAAEGAALLGPELLWWTDYRSRRIIRQADLAELCDSAPEWDEHDAMWPDPRRAQAAGDAAGRMDRAGMLDTAQADPAAPLPAGAAGHAVTSRDLDNAGRWPDRAAADPALFCWAAARRAARKNASPAQPASIGAGK